MSELSTPLWAQASRRGKLGASLAAAVQLLALFFLVWQPTIGFSVDPSRAQPNGGNAYVVPVPDPGQFGYRLLGDTNDRPKQSALLVWEAGQPLGPAHSLHDTIRSQGGGAYSHWGPALYFSASDNSDPRISGKTYQIESRLSPQPELRWLLLALLAAATAALLWTGRALAAKSLLYAKAALVYAPAESFSIALLLAGCYAGAVLVFDKPPAEAAVGPLGPLLLGEALEAREWSRSAAPYYILRTSFPQATFLLASDDIVSEVHLRRLARARDVKYTPEPRSLNEKVIAELDRAATREIMYYARTTLPIELSESRTGSDRPMTIIAGDNPGAAGQKVSIFLGPSKIYVVPATWLNEHEGYK